jgi:hypothetical protein
MNNGAVQPAGGGGGGGAPPPVNLPLPPPIQAQQAIGNAIPQPGLAIQIPPFVWNPNVAAQANGQPPNFQAQLNAIPIGPPVAPQGQWIFPQLAPQPAHQGPHNPVYAFIHGLAQGQDQDQPMQGVNENGQQQAGPIPMNLNEAPQNQLVFPNVPGHAPGQPAPQNPLVFPNVPGHVPGQPAPQNPWGFPNVPGHVPGQPAPQINWNQLQAQINALGGRRRRKSRRGRSRRGRSRRGRSRRN